MRRVMFWAILAALLAALALPLMASASAPAAHGWGSRFPAQCRTSPYASPYRAVANGVLAEYQVNAPEDASPALVDRIVRLYERGCGGVLDSFVRGRVGGGAAWAWYLAVVGLNT